MKRIFLYIIVAFGTIILTQSCKKDTKTEETNQVINHVLQVNQSYQLDLGSFGIEDGASITRQATNFSVSSLDRNNLTGKITYQYIPAQHFAGTDEVEISSVRGSDGASPGDKIINTTIKFIITN